MTICNHNIYGEQCPECEIAARDAEIDELKKALELACEDTNTWRRTMNICSMEPDYFRKKARGK